MPETTTIRFRVQPGFAAVTAILAACGWSMHTIAVGGGHWTLGPVSFSAIFTVALLALIAVHEASHVVAGRLQGQRLIGVRIGSKFGVTMLGDHTPRSMLLTVASGPLIGSAAAVTVLAATDPWSPIWAAALVALIENLANVGLFFLPGSDGSKIVAALKEMGADAATNQEPAAT